MAEETESIRADSATREQKQKEIIDWSGKRLILPRGTTLPATGLSGEVFVKINAAATDQLYTFDLNINNWTTIGP